MNEYIEYLSIYLILLLITLFVGINFKRNQKNIIYISVWIFLAIFSGTRLCVGQDWVGYGNFFAETQKNGLQIFSAQDPTEFFYKIIAYAVSSLGFSFEIFNMLISALICFLIAVSFRKISEQYCFLLTLLYFSTLYFSQQFGIVRTGLAVGVFVYSYTIIDRSNLRFLGLGVAAFNIHRTSIVPSLILLISKFLDKKYLIIFSILVIFVDIVDKTIVINFIKSILQEFNFQYAQYLEDADRYFQKLPITNLTFLVIFFLSASKIFGMEPKKILENFALIFITINIVLNYSFLGRFNAYGAIIMLIYFIDVITHSKGIVKIILLSGMYLYSFLGLSNVLFSPDLLLFRNYETWLFNVDRSFIECDTSLQY